MTEKQKADIRSAIQFNRAIKARGRGDMSGAVNWAWKAARTADQAGEYGRAHLCMVVALVPSRFGPEHADSN